jgi:GNAT superfamily N-acetyltransferase
VAHAAADAGTVEGVTFEIRPASQERFDDAAVILAPKRAGAQGCWCLSYRLPPKLNQELAGAEARGRAFEALCERDHAPGVLAYEDGDVVGWAGIAPRRELEGFDPRRFPVDPEADTWVLYCFRVRAGHGKKGVAHALIAGAIDYARFIGASTVEAYPVQTDGDRIDRTQAFSGTVAMFTRAGFAVVGDTGYKVQGHDRVVMRLAL